MERPNEVQAYLKHQKKLVILQFAKVLNQVSKALKHFKVPKSTFYKWKKTGKGGSDGLLRKHPVAYNHPGKIKEDKIEKVLSLRKEYQLGFWRIKWYLERYNCINISKGRVLPEYLSNTE